MKTIDYTEVKRQVRGLASSVLPDGVRVAVVSRGDDSLLDLGALAAEHFPRLADGRYIGHHPADGEEAVRWLQEARADGARYLLVPSTSFWWLDYYGELRRHLETHCRLVLRQKHVCTIYDLGTCNAPSRRRKRVYR